MHKYFVNQFKIYFWGGTGTEWQHLMLLRHYIALIFPKDSYIMKRENIKQIDNVISYL